MGVAQAPELSRIRCLSSQSQHYILAPTTHCSLCFTYWQWDLLLPDMGQLIVMHVTSKNNKEKNKQILSLQRGI